MNNRIRNKLIQVARTRSGPISYQRLINEVELGLNMAISHEKALLGEILNEISIKEHENNRPLLSALIKMKTNIGQGDNFYKLCEQLGFGEWKELKRDKDFTRLHRKKCYQFWSDSKNYEKYF